MLQYKLKLTCVPVGTLQLVSFFVVVRPVAQALPCVTSSIAFACCTKRLCIHTLSGFELLLVLCLCMSNSMRELSCVQRPCSRFLRMQSIASSAKGSRGSTSDFLDSSSRLFSASTSQQSNTAAHGTSITGTGHDRYSPQAIAEREKPPDSRRHHYTPRDTLSSTYPEDQPSSTNSGHATNMTRLETHSADTDPSRTGATDSSIRQDNNNASTTKIGVLPAQASPAAGRRSHVDGTRSSASHGSATPSPVLTTQYVPMHWHKLTACCIIVDLKSVRRSGADDLTSLTELVFECIIACTSLILLA